MIFEGSSIRQRLQRIIVLTTAVALAAMGAVLIFLEWRNSLAAEKMAITSTGRIIADASSATLAFGSPDEAEQMLSAFQSEPDVRAAALYDATGKLFASYRASEATRPLPPTPAADGLVRQGRLLHLFRPVLEGEKRFGTLYLRTDLEDMYARLSRYAVFALLIFIGALIGASVIGRALQKSISEPMLSLAQTAQAISEKHDYTVRAHGVWGGELGLLTNAFNHMLNEIQQQQQALEREKELLATTLASIGDAVIVTNESGRLTFMNGEAERLTGWTSREAAGRPLTEVFRIVNEETRQPVESPVEKVLRVGAVVGLANHTILIARDGRETPIDDSAAPIRKGDQPLFGVVLVFRDFTERKRAENALRESEARERARVEELEALFATVPTPVWFSNDAECQVIVGNPTANAFLGVARGQNVSLSAPGEIRVYQTLRNGVEVPADQLPMQRAAREGVTIQDEEYELVLSDGRHVHLLMHAAPLRDAEGRSRGALAAGMDITERKKAEAILQETQAKLAVHAADLERKVDERTARLQEMVDELQHVSYAMAHDMRAPLRAMNMFATLLSEQASTSAAPVNTEEFSRRIIVAANRLDQLIQDALQYTKAAQHEMPLRPVDLSRMMRDLIETYPNLHPDKADISIVGELPVVMGNDSLLTQCFSNLLGNAVKFVAPGTKPAIRIHAEIRGSFARIWVSDNGIGIPENAQPRLFKMFQKLDHGYEGTGIGLAIVRKVVERMKGKVGVESEAGKGSRFWVEIPVATASAENTMPNP